VHPQSPTFVSRPTVADVRCPLTATNIKLQVHAWTAAYLRRGYKDIVLLQHALPAANVPPVHAHLAAQGTHAQVGVVPDLSRLLQPHTYNADTTPSTDHTAEP
jgi:hypothetical protein